MSFGKGYAKSLKLVNHSAWASVKEVIKERLPSPIVVGIFLVRIYLAGVVWATLEGLFYVLFFGSLNQILYSIRIVELQARALGT